MDDNKKPRQNDAENEQRNDNANQQNVSNQPDENPQEGRKWNNYRTRELADEEDNSQRSGEEKSGSLY